MTLLEYREATDAIRKKQVALHVERMELERKLADQLSSLKVGSVYESNTRKNKDGSPAQALVTWILVEEIGGDSPVFSAFGRWLNAKRRPGRHEEKLTLRLEIGEKSEEFTLANDQTYKDQ